MTVRAIMTPQARAGTSSNRPTQADDRSSFISTLNQANRQPVKRYLGSLENATPANRSASLSLAKPTNTRAASSVHRNRTVSNTRPKPATDRKNHSRDATEQREDQFSAASDRETNRVGDEPSAAPTTTPNDQGRLDRDQGLADPAADTRALSEPDAADDPQEEFEAGALPEEALAGLSQTQPISEQGDPQASSQSEQAAGQAGAQQATTGQGTGLVAQEKPAANLTGVLEGNFATGNTEGTSETTDSLAQNGHDTDSQEGLHKDHASVPGPKAVVPSVAQGTAADTALPTTTQPAENAAAVAPPAPSPGSAAAPAAQANVPLPEPGTLDVDPNVSRVIRGMQGAMNQNGGSVTLRLSPPELGLVRIQMQIEHSQVVAQIHTQSESVRNLLSQQLGQLRHTLESQGLNVTRLQVQVMADQASLFNDQQEADQSPGDGRSRGEYAQTNHQHTDDRDQAGEQPSQNQNAFEQVLNAVA